MDKEMDEMTERILNLTLEIIYLLTGEDYTVLKKTSVECVSSRPCVSRGLSRTQSPITVPPPHSLIHERNNDQRILELTNKIIQLLTGEVPIRCQDVTVYFSMEEWEYLEGHKDLYKDVMMENHQSLTSLDGSSKRNIPQRCPRPLYSQNHTEENDSIPQDYQGEYLITIKAEDIDEVEDSYVTDQQCTEEDIPTYINADGHTSKIMSDGLLILSPDISHYTGQTNFTPDIHPVFHSTDLAYDFFPNNSDIVTHNTIHIDDTMFPFSESVKYFTYENHIVKKQCLCSECGKCFTHKSSLVKHQKIHTGEKPFACTECGKCFTQRSNLIKHQIIHAIEKPFSCSECGKCFAQKTRLIIHQRMHSDEKPFSCSQCGKCFTYKPYLFEHQRIHRSDKPFPCSECGKCFTQKSHLVKHQIIHRGVKPFSCSDCGKCFTKKSNLVEHQRIHKGEKPFPCSECGKCFTCKSHLVKHLRTHTGEKPFPCSECGKCFTQKSNLLEHQRIHTGEKPFTCFDCGKCFTKKSNLGKHQRIHAHLL